MEQIQENFMLDPDTAINELWHLLDEDRELAREAWRWYLPGLTNKQKMVELLQDLAPRKISFGELVEWFHDTDAALDAINIFVDWIIGDYEMIEECYDVILSSDEVLNSHLELPESKTETIRLVLDSDLSLAKDLKIMYGFQGNEAYNFLPKEGCAMDLVDDERDMPRTSFIIARMLMNRGMIPQVAINELMNNYRSSWINFFEKLRN